MRYSIEIRGLLKFKSLSNKYSQKLLDSSKKSTTDAIKTTSKIAIPKTAETTGNLIGNKTAYKDTNVSKNLLRNYIYKMRMD